VTIGTYLIFQHRLLTEY